MRMTRVETFIIHCPIREISDSFNQSAVYGMLGVFIETDAGITGAGTAIKPKFLEKYGIR